MISGESNHEAGRILIVDDEVELMNALCEILSAQGYETVGCPIGAEALTALRDREFDLLLTDLMMPEMDGIELIRAGLAIDPNIIGIIMTGQGTVQTAVAAMRTGAFDYILKPFKLAHILPLLSRAMQVRHLRLENTQLKETVAIHELGKAISLSSDLNAILDKVADAALQQFSADEVSIMLPTPDGQELYVAVVHGGNRECVGARAPIRRGIAGWVACNREFVVLRGKVNDPRMAPIRPRADILTAVSMPMLSGGNLVGVLNVNITKNHRQVTLGQVKALNLLVSIIAPVLENTRLNIQIRKGEQKYRSIFENAIEGIFQRSPEGRIVSANPAFARIFGYCSPEDLMANITHFVRDVYVDPDRGAEFDRLMETDGEARNFEYRARRKDGSQIWISVTARAVRDEKGVLLHYEGMNEDVSDRKLSESRRKLAKDILETLNRPNDIQKLINDILRLLKEHTGFEAIGIRLKEGEDYPYFVTSGFPAGFLEAENHLCIRDDAGPITHDTESHPILECLCGDVLCGRTDPSLTCFTKGGSFWTNSTTELMASTSNACQRFTRNRCNSEGYESLALIPLRSRGVIIGLLQLNDSRRNAFTPDRILFFEGIGASIGIAVSRLRSVEALSESIEKLRRSIDDTIRAMAMIVETRDPYTAGHQERVANLAVAIGQEMNIPAEKINGIRMAGMIHDVGKAKVPAEILSKPGKLSHLEFSLIKSHAEVGYEILRSIEFPYPIAQIAYQHHERVDGSGYPRGLKGEEILLEARIIAVADVVEAIVSHRPYRPALGIDAAIEEISINSGILYDPEVTDACLKLLQKKGFSLD